MAIPFLNNIDLSDNQLLNAKLQVTSPAPTSAAGQIYYNSISNIAQYYNGTAWVELISSTGGTVTSVTSGDTNTITIGGTAIDPTVAANTASVTNGSLNLATGDQIYDFVIGLGYVESVGIGNSTFVSLADSGTSADPVLTASLSAAGTPGTTNFLRGDNTWAVPVDYGNWVASDNVTTETVTTGETVKWVGSGTTGVVLSGGVFTITSNDEFVGTVTSVAATHGGDAFTASIGNVATVNPSVDITMNGASTDYIDGEGNLTAFPPIPQGNVTGIDAGTYISIDDNGTATPTVNALGTATPYVAATDDSKLVARDANGYGYVKTPASGDSTTKIATTAFVQQAVTGLLEFKGGFDANTGLLNPATPSPAPQDLYADIPLEIGDYYVATVAGNFFGDSAYPLTPGDSVIATIARAAGAAVVTDFAVVQSDTDLATLTTVGIGNVNAGAGVDVSYSSGTATVSLTATAARSGSIAVPTSTTYTYPNSITSTDGVNSVLIQLVDSTGETVYADVTRLTATTFSVDYGVAEPTGVIALIQLIG